MNKGLMVCERVQRWMRLGRIHTESAGLPGGGGRGVIRRGVEKKVSVRTREGQSRHQRYGKCFLLFDGARMYCVTLLAGLPRISVCSRGCATICQTSTISGNTLWERHQISKMQPQSTTQNVVSKMIFAGQRQ